MNVDDFTPVYKLGLRCYNVLDKPYNYWSIREVAAHLEGNPELCYVAEENGNVVGFVLGEESYQVLENTGHLEWIAVAPEYRRQGVATRLVEHIMRIYQGLGKEQVVTDISRDNAASRGMARKSGFTEGISVTFFVKTIRKR
jgi:ribosomal protein S18 acetylase RimI-like enzyme